MKQKNKIIETYKDEKTTKSFDSGRKKFKFQKYKHKIEANFLKKTIRDNSKKEMKILDVACGTGRMLPEVFVENPLTIYEGLDTSKEMTNYLKLKAKKINKEKSVNLTIGDASKIPFGNNEFDIVYTYHLIWHLPHIEQEKIISEMIRVCKPGGKVIFDILNKNFIWENIKNLIGRRSTEGIYKFEMCEIKKLINNKKFEIEKLSDAPIENSFVYGIFNLVNVFRKILPLNLFHMIFFRIEK